MKQSTRRIGFHFIASVAVCLAIMSQPAQAAIKQWVGPTTNNYWTNANNWSPVGQPAGGDDPYLTQTDAINRTVLYNANLNLLYGQLRIDATGTGTMTLEKAFNPLRANQEIVGVDGTGIFNHNSGSNTITQNLIVALNSGSSGIYNLKSGSLSASEEYIGNSGIGTFTQGSGANTLTNLYLGGNTGSLGTYNLNSGKLNAGNEIIGNSGAGIFNQYSGSTNTVGNQLILGATSAATSSGTYNLNGGSLTALQEFIGFVGTGTFTQIGGTNTTTSLNPVGSLNLGFAGGSHGTYNLKNGNLKGVLEIIGDTGTGVFNHFNGYNTLTSNLILARSGGNGTYNLQNGYLNADNVLVGDLGTGIFNQTGGSNTVATLLQVGGGASSNGTYNLTNGKLAANFEIIGRLPGSTGIFNQTGGTNTVTNTLTLAFLTGSSGTYNLEGGKLSAGTIDINPGGIFNVKNVTTTVTGNVMNYGTVKTTNANVTWNGTFTNNGAYISDPSTQTFKGDLLVGSAGYLVGHSQDLFIIKENFINQSADSTNWDTDQAGLRFAAGADNIHDFYIPGVDNGPTPIPNNFAWGTLNISGQIVNLKDGSDADGGAQYVGALVGASLSGTTVTNIFGDAALTLNIYYDPTLAANAYLAGGTYNYAGGLGQLIPDPPPNPTPVPSSVLLMGTGLLGLGALGWRRRKRG